MEELVIQTEIYAPPSDVFSFVRDFRGYAEYSDYLADVCQDGDGGVGTTYELTAEWWRITYRAQTEVTDIEPPDRIDWRVVDVIDANGAWELESTTGGTLVTLRIAFDAASADTGAVNLPRFVSLAWVFDRVKPIVELEAIAIVERIVADLEGSSREVELEMEFIRDH